MIKIASFLAEYASFLDEQQEYDLADQVHDRLIKMSQTDMKFNDGRPMQGLMNNFLWTGLGRNNGMFMENNPLASPTQGLDAPMIAPTPPGPNATQQEWNQYQLELSQYQQKMMEGPSRNYAETFSKYQADAAYYRALQEGSTQQEAVQRGQQAYTASMQSLTPQSQMAFPPQQAQSTQAPQQPMTTVQLAPQSSE